MPNLKREACVIEGRNVKRKAAKRRKNRTRRKRERPNMAVRGQRWKGGTAVERSDGRATYGCMYEEHVTNKQENLKIIIFH